MSDHWMSGTARTHFAVLTATPDLLAQGLIATLIEKLAQNGVRVIGAMPYRFSAAAAAELYAGRITHNRSESRLHSGWLNPQMFTAGPSLILFLTSSERNKPLVDFIRDLKGGSRLGEHRAEHLRNLSPLTDRGFSLVHSPDDFDGVLHELRLVLGKRAIAQLLAPGRPPLREEEIVSILPLVPLTAEPHLFDILPRIVGQVAAMCACAAMNDGIAAPAARLLNQTRACRRDLAAERIDPTLERQLWMRMAMLQVAVGELVLAQRSQIDWTLELVDLRRALRTSELLASVATCCLEGHFNVIECEALIEVLSACHLVPSVWDRHRLRLIAAYHRRPMVPTHG